MTTGTLYGLGSPPRSKNELVMVVVHVGAGTQALLPHTSPAGHTMPQPPQLSLSSLVFEHCPPQSVSPAGHTQALSAQRNPAEQTTPGFP